MLTTPHQNCDIIISVNLNRNLIIVKY